MLTQNGSGSRVTSLEKGFQWEVLTDADYDADRPTKENIVRASCDPDTLESDSIIGFQMFYASALVSDSVPGDRLLFICEASRSLRPIAKCS